MFVFVCLNYLYALVYLLLIAVELDVFYILFITCDICLVLSCFSLVVVGEDILILAYLVFFCLKL
jgi:hypothetical protein